MKEAKNLEGEKICGIIMPISATNGSNTEHWENVKIILSDAITETKLIPNLVCDSDSSLMISDTITKNLYYNRVVICDISSLNHNVMLELGMRLAFNKPTIIVKDDITEKPFDTNSLRMEIYPHDLNNKGIKIFKANLTKKINESINNHDYKPFLAYYDIPYTNNELKAKIREQKQYSLNYVTKQFDRLAEIGAREEMAKVKKKTVIDYLDSITEINDRNAAEQKLLEYVYVFNRIGAGIYNGVLERDVIYDIWQPIFFRNHWDKYRGFMKKKREDNATAYSYFDFLANDDYWKYKDSPENGQSYFDWLANDEYQKLKDKFPRVRAQNIPHTDNPIDY